MSTVCVDCGASLVAERVWRRMSATERQQWVERGFRQCHARNLCSADYQRRNYAGTLIDVERPSLSRDELLDEWHHFTKDRDTHTQNVKAFAAYVGRSYRAVERALLRAGVTAATRTH